MLIKNFLFFNSHLKRTEYNTNTKTQRMDLQMKEKQMRIKCAIIAACIAVTSVFTLFSCSSSSNTEGMGNYGITSVKLNDRGELIVEYSDGRQQNLGAISNEGSTIVIEGGESTISTASSVGLASAVSITSHFEMTYRYSYGGFFPGYGGTKTEAYKYEGSGVIYKIDRQTGSAFIITNYHVVYDSACNTEDGISDNIEVFLYGAEDEEYAIPAEYVGGSLYYDIAVLYVENCDALKNSAHNAPMIGDSENVAVGTTAIAIGNPQVYGISAALGIVSVNSEYSTMTAADEKSTVEFRVMRVDSAINSGNSGGGLYNEKGELIGIVNAKIVKSTVENIGYAIPSNVAVAVADNIVDNCFGKDSKTVKRAILGAELGSSDSIAVMDESSGMIKIKETVTIAEVLTQSPAAGKLKVGDVIESITLNSETVEVTRKHQIMELLVKARSGDTVTIKIRRNGKEMDVKLDITSSCVIDY